MLGFCSSMEADAGSAGHLAEDRQRALELRRVGDLNPIDESRNDIVGVLKGIREPE